MTTPEHVLAAIARLASGEPKRPLFVCIDGFGGSGKSTLAGLIRHAPEVSTIVEGDDFYGPESPDWAGFSPQEGYEHFFDYKRLAREVLRPLRGSEDTRLQRYDWQRNVLGDWVELRAEGVVVVEGVYMLRPSLREFWDRVRTAKMTSSSGPTPRNSTSGHSIPPPARTSCCLDTDPSHAKVPQAPQLPHPGSSDDAVFPLSDPQLTDPWTPSVVGSLRVAWRAESGARWSRSTSTSPTR